MQETDDILVERLRSKDKLAFELVFNKFYGLLRSYALRFVDDADEAEEVVQGVFVKFWEKCDQLNPDSSIKNYLYRAVHNSALNQLKHQKVRDAYQEYVIQFIVDTSPEHLPDATSQEQTNTRIINEIDKLPKRCAEIFRLSRFDGLKYREIAEYLEISVKTVEVQMGKALKTLRENLHDLK